ncbi:MAG: uridine kinase [Gaiellaceae bacterium]
MPARHFVIQELGDALAAVHAAGRLTRFGVDGVDSAGKTRLADEMAQELTTRGRPAVRISLDQFERPPAERYARGELSPEGFYLDSFDLERFRAHALSIEMPVEASVVCDGVFLHRPELADLWDVSIFVDADLEIAAQRGAERNLVWTDSLDATHERFRTRYMPAQRRYIEEQRPHERATFVVENTRLDLPELVRNSRGP